MKKEDKSFISEIKLFLSISILSTLSMGPSIVQHLVLEPLRLILEGSCQLRLSSNLGLIGPMKNRETKSVSLHPSKYITVKHRDTSPIALNNFFWIEVFSQDQILLKWIVMTLAIQ